MKRSFIEELQCPLTHSLPIDPVIGDDGQLYEKEAISEWLKKSKKSPMTMQEMHNFTETKQINNIIQLLWEYSMKNETNNCEYLLDWNLRREEDIFFKKTIQQSKNFTKESGYAHLLLAKWYFYGHPKIGINLYKWFEHLCEANDRGIDISKNPTNAFILSSEFLYKIASEREEIIKKIYDWDFPLELLNLTILTFDRYMSLCCNKTHNTVCIMNACFQLSKRDLNITDLKDYFVVNNEIEQIMMEIENKINKILVATPVIYVDRLNYKAKIQAYNNSNMWITMYEKLIKLFFKLTLLDIKFVLYDSFVVAFSIILLCHSICKLSFPLNILELYPNKVHIDLCMKMQIEKLKQIIENKDILFVSDLNDIMLKCINNRIHNITWTILPNIKSLKQ